MSHTLRVGAACLQVGADETVLEALERAGIDAASGCRAGACMKCLVRAVGEPPAGSQKGLRSTLASLGYFLACSTRLTADLEIEDATAPAEVESHVESIDVVGPLVARLVLRPKEAFAFRAGQYVDLVSADGASRSYSVASLPSTGALEFHVRLVAGGAVSPWLHARQAGDVVRLRGPFGQCFYIQDEQPKPLLLAGVGTGLAPLLGIARDALAQGHDAPIDLVHGGFSPDRLYLRDELARLAAEAPNLTVHHCVLQNGTDTEHTGDLDKYLLQVAQQPTGSRAFLCGDEAIVAKLRRALFLHGMPSNEIFADPFTSTAKLTGTKN